MMKDMNPSLNKYGWVLIREESTNDEGYKPIS
jgi:hypothetical protein